MRRIALCLSLALLTPVAASAQSEGGGRPAQSLDPSFRRPGALMDASPQRRPNMLAVFVGFPYSYWGWGGVPLGVSGRYYLPLLHDGFIPTVNDSFGLDVGADVLLVFGPGVFFVDVPAELMWALHFTPDVTGYMKLGVALELGFSGTTTCWGNQCITGFRPWVEPVGALGVIIKLNQQLQLRLEGGYPWGKIGLNWEL